MWPLDPFAQGTGAASLVGRVSEQTFNYHGAQATTADGFNFPNEPFGFTTPLLSDANQAQPAALPNKPFAFTTPLLPDANQARVPVAQPATLPNKPFGFTMPLLPDANQARVPVTQPAALSLSTLVSNVGTCLGRSVMEPSLNKPTNPFTDYHIPRAAITNDLATIHPPSSPATMTDENGPPTNPPTNPPASTQRSNGGAAKKRAAKDGVVRERVKKGKKDNTEGGASSEVGDVPLEPQTGSVGRPMRRSVPKKTWEETEFVMPKKGTKAKGRGQQL